MDMNNKTIYTVTVEYSSIGFKSYKFATCNHILMKILT